MEGPSSQHFNWAKSLEFVLTDRPALDAFQEWLREYSAPQYLDLHFAIKAYERMVIDENPKRKELAKTIYSTFISTRSGNCETIPSRIRNQISEKLRSFSGSEIDPQIFANCSEFVDGFLRKQHEQFVSSDEFFEAFNKIHFECPSSMNTMERRRSNGLRKNADKYATQLTAEALLKSRHDRQTTLGETKLEKKYKPIRQPYVCNATTSHNDSAVSSSFSGDTPASHRATRMRHVRDEQARENAPTLTVPRVENSHRVDGQQFDHSTENGRKMFALEVTKRLMKILDKMKLNDETEKKINDIEQCKYTTLDMIYGTNADEDLEKIDEEDELDDYLKKMKDYSQRASRNRSPKLDRTFSPPREGNKTSTNIDRMAQSMIAFSTVSPYNRTLNYNKISLDTFTPQMNSHPNSAGFHCYSATSSKSRDGGSQMYDSSGIGSMAPSAFSASSDSSRDRRSTSNGHHHHHHHHHAQKLTSNGGYFGRSTPKKHKTKSNMANLITISYIETNGVPVVAHVADKGQMTLGEFRNHFLLPSSSSGHSQLFFKSECEDESAPYQLLLIKDDNQILPVFEGRITAELR